MKYCRACGGVIHENGPPRLTIPKEIQTEVTAVIESLNDNSETFLSESKAKSFINELNAMVREDGKLVRKYPFARIKKAAAKWKAGNHARRGKGHHYFLGILRGLEDEAVAEKRCLDDLPPLIT